MRVLGELKPEKVFYYFEEISKIPHGSGNIDEISDFLVNFAKARGLECIQDATKNVIIKKNATRGYENEPALILQGHMDMVAVSVPDLELDMSKEGLKLQIEGDNICAKGTSLGGDDGIAVAYALAILDSDNIAHPDIEVVITVDEEVGMEGARALDTSYLKGNRMINLDSEEEGIFLTSCAGGVRFICNMPVERKSVSGQLIEVKISGLMGGHSGEEIIKERGNSNCIFGRLLKGITRNVESNLVDAKGGLADNAIPRETIFSIVVDENQMKDINLMVEDIASQIKAELGVRDPLFNVTVIDKGSVTTNALTKECTEKIAAFVMAMPNGIQTMSADVSGLVETSLNMGILTLDERFMELEFCIRSCIDTAKDALVEKLISIVDLSGGTYRIVGSYPGWKYRVNSPLREKMIAVYQQIYNTTPKLLAIHAGLECGLFAEKIDELDCVSIGPDMKNIHTTEETLSISSVARVWDYLLELLATKDA